jgi:hypothetical protein
MAARMTSGRTIVTDGDQFIGMISDWWSQEEFDLLRRRFNNIGRAQDLIDRMFRVIEFAPLPEGEETLLTDVQDFQRDVAPLEGIS